MQNLIIGKSFRYNNEIEVKIKTDMAYDKVLGFWTSLTDNKPLVLSDNKYKPQTKKEDIETGEDRKGE